MALRFKSQRVAIVAVLSFVTATFIGLGVVSDAHALGLGTANADSFIGERLTVRIPLLNVENPDQLLVSLGPDGSASSNAVLSALIDRASSQPSVLIRSVGLITEPYINFTLNLSDGQSSFIKEFTVLLDLAPGAGSSSTNLAASSDNIGRSQRLGSNRVATEPLGNSFNNSFDNSLANNNRAGSFNNNRSTGSVLGPFDFAQENNIPEKFGAVIDGQSLWRVARRINGAMGVSINQMMLALYKNNPEAFLSESVDSLKAGVFLDIPSFAQVNELSDSESKTVLDRLSSGVPSPVVDRSSGAESDLPFQLTAIDEVIENATNSASNQGGDDQPAGNDQKTQEIISSLAKTVGNLTQELIRKDNQIKFLTAKVEALEAYANIDGDTLVGINAGTIDGSVDNELSKLAEGSLSSEADGSLLADGSSLVADGSLPTDGSLEDDSSLSIESSLAEDDFSLPEGSLPSEGSLELPVDEELSPEDVLSPEDFKALEDSLSTDDSLSADGSLSADDSLLTEDSLSADGSLPADGSPESIDIDGSVDALLEDIETQVETELTEGSSNIDVSSAVEETSSGFLNLLSQWWKWLASGLGLLLLGLLAFIFRDRFSEIRRSLNLFGSNDSVEFSEPIIKGGLTTYRADNTNVSQDGYSTAQTSDWESQNPTTGDEYQQSSDAVNSESGLAEDSDAPVEPLEFEPYAAREEDSELTADEEDLTVEQATEYAEYVTTEEESDDEEEEVEFATTDSDLDTEAVIDFVAKSDAEIELVESDQQDLGFNERFESLLEQKDYDFARELLDFARHNEIDEQHYHCERLVLLHAMKDEEGFYDYYYEIESKVTEFDQDLQTKISKLVVELAQK